LGKYGILFEHYATPTEVFLLFSKIYIKNKNMQPPQYTCGLDRTAWEFNVPFKVLIVMPHTTVNFSTLLPTETKNFV
jgi:hypothetical protein